MAYGVLNINDQNLFATSQTNSTTQLDFTLFSDFNHYQTFTTGVNSVGSEGTGFGAAASTAALGISNATSTAGFGGVTGPASAISITTSALSNATDVGAINTQVNLLPGIPIPTTGFVTKYEFETRLRTAGTIHSDTVRGCFRAGFMDSGGMGTAGDTTLNGVYFRFLCNGTTTNTTWNIIWINSDGGATTAVNTGVSLAINTTYRMYLSVEVDPAGVFTTTYRILNENTGTKTEGTASPSNSAHYPGVSYGYAIGAAIVNCKTVTATTTPIALYADYMGVRIRRPISNRDILIGKI